MRHLLPILALALPLAASPAHAANWQVLPGSTLGFTATQAGTPLHGSFSRFAPEVTFDPQAPENGRIQVRVDMQSARLDDADNQAMLPGKDWFFTEKFPDAQFVSTAIRHGAQAGQYIAEGTLTLRGISRPVTLPFSLDQREGITHVEGAATLSRQDFGVGQGQWADDKWIAFPVEVTFHLLAKPH